MGALARSGSFAVGVILVAACGSSSTSSSPGAALPSSSSALPPAATAASAAAARCTTSPLPFDAKNIHLDGAWAGDDGGIYYLRQRDDILWWNGMSGRDGAPSRLGRGWNNVARGEIDGLTIDVDWVDVPRGTILGYGTLDLRIEDDGSGNVRIVKVAETGTGFGNSVWLPCTPS
jgi:hypothetical protein